MKKIIFSQVLVENGVTNFNGLYDENRLPVAIELEKDDDGTVMTIIRKKLTEPEIQAICNEYDDCDICPLCEECLEGIEDE